MTWEQYKAALSARRKQKWREDIAYRAAQIQRDKKRRERLRKAVMLTKQGHYLSRLQKVLEGKGKIKPVKIAHGGTQELMLSTGGLADVVERTVVRIQQWLREGLLPGHTCRIANRRFFSVDYVRAICQALYETELQNARGDSEIFRAVVREKVLCEGIEVRDGEGNETDYQKVPEAEDQDKRNA